MKSDEVKKQLTILGLSLAVSILIGVFVPGFTKPEQTLLTIGLFIAFVMIHPCCLVPNWMAYVPLKWVSNGIPYELRV